MENKIAIIGIIVKGNNSSAECINSVLHDYSQYIIGRLGLPYRTKGVYIISIALDAPQSMIEEIVDKIEELENVNAKTLYA